MSYSLNDILQFASVNYAQAAVTGLFGVIGLGFLAWASWVSNALRKKGIIYESCQAGAGTSLHFRYCDADMDVRTGGRREKKRGKLLTLLHWNTKLPTSNTRIHYGSTMQWKYHSRQRNCKNWPKMTTSYKGNLVQMLLREHVSV